MYLGQIVDCAVCLDFWAHFSRRKFCEELPHLQQFAAPTSYNYIPKFDHASFVVLAIWAPGDVTTKIFSSSARAIVVGEWVVMMTLKPFSLTKTFFTTFKKIVFFLCVVSLGNQSKMLTHAYHLVSFLQVPVTETPTIAHVVWTWLAECLVGYIYFLEWHNLSPRVPPTFKR